MIAFPPAKINLGLNVIEKRMDGFHNIETVFYPVQWCDVLEILEADDFKIFQTGIKVFGDEKNNLCVKAYQLLKADFNLPAVHIHLHKNIPMGAGLGGGSSDAAHTLLLLNTVFELNLSIAQLSTYAVKLGSDCAFFLHRQPMLGKGKGELLSPIKINLNNYFIVVIMPPHRVNTADAYSTIQPKHPHNTIEELIEEPIGKWKNNLQNDFEVSVFERFPSIKEIKEKLYSLGAIYASMSGSGAAVFGIFEEERDLKNVFANSMVWCGKL